MDVVPAEEKINGNYDVGVCSKLFLSASFLLHLSQTKSRLCDILSFLISGISINVFTEMETEKWQPAPPLDEFEGSDTSFPVTVFKLLLWTWISVRKIVQEQDDRFNHTNIKSS